MVAPLLRVPKRAAALQICQVVVEANDASYCLRVITTRGCGFRRRGAPAATSQARSRKGGTSAGHVKFSEKRAFPPDSCVLFAPLSRWPLSLLLVRCQTVKIDWRYQTFQPIHIYESLVLVLNCCRRLGIF